MNPRYNSCTASLLLAAIAIAGCGSIAPSSTDPSEGKAQEAARAIRLGQRSVTSASDPELFAALTQLKDNPRRELRSPELADSAISSPEEAARLLDFNHDGTLDSLLVEAIIDGPEVSSAQAAYRTFIASLFSDEESETIAFAKKYYSDHFDAETQQPKRPYRYDRQVGREFYKVSDANQKVLWQALSSVYPQLLADTLEHSSLLHHPRHSILTTSAPDSFAKYSRLAYQRLSLLQFAAWMVRSKPAVDCQQASDAFIATLRAIDPGDRDTLRLHLDAFAETQTAQGSTQARRCIESIAERVAAEILSPPSLLAAVPPQTSRQLVNRRDQNLAGLPIEHAQADQIMRTWQNASAFKGWYGSNVLANGCEPRARAVCRELRSWVYGRVEPRSPPPAVFIVRWDVGDHMSNSRQGWGYHVSAGTWVRDGNGNISPMVFDTLAKPIHDAGQADVYQPAVYPWRVFEWDPEYLSKVMPNENGEKVPGYEHLTGLKVYARPRTIEAWLRYWLFDLSKVHVSLSVGYCDGF